MPTIIVQSNPSTEQDSTAAIIFLEDVQPEHLASDHHAAQLIERVGWAVTDAQEAEAEEHPALLSAVRRKQR